MYLYVEGVKKAIPNIIGSVPMLDSRVADYISNDFVSYLRKDPGYYMHLGLSDKTEVLGTVQLVTWADAPESLRRAVMNGEKTAALCLSDCRRAMFSAIKHVSRFVRKGEGRGTPSLEGYHYGSIKAAYDASMLRIREKRRARQAKSQMVRFFVEGDVEMFLLLGNAALGVVGSALRNCVRDAYTSKSSDRFGRTSSRLYVAFRSISTGKWTSLGDAYWPSGWSNIHAIFPDRKLVHNCHEWLENEADYKVDADAALWKRLLDGEFLTTLHQHWHGFQKRKADRVKFLEETLFPERRVVMPPILDTSTILSLGRRGGSAFFFREWYQAFQNREGWLEIDSNFGQLERRTIRNNLMGRAYGIHVDGEYESEAAVTNAASPAFGRVRNQLALRGEQKRRATAGRGIPGILRGLVSRV